MSSWLWFVLLFTLLTIVEGKNLSRKVNEEDDDGDDDEEGSAGAQRDFTRADNTTLGASERRTEGLTKKEVDDAKLKWTTNVDAITKLADELANKSVVTNDGKDDLYKKVNELKFEINKQNTASLTKTLAEVKERADKNGARATPLIQQNINRVTTATNVILNNGDALIKNIKKGDGWATAATVCTMISGVTAVVPHPASLVASALFGIVAFFINLASKKTIEQAKPGVDPYSEINKNIEAAVMRINQHGRLIELSKLMAPLTLAQEISETFLPLTGTRFTLGEFRYWLWSNSVPNMNSFVDSLAIIQSYLTTMATDLKKDETHKLLTMVYVKIAIIRDIVLTGLDLLFPTKTGPDANADPKEFDDLKRLRKSIQDSLNRQKKRTFEFLAQYHKPTPEQLPIIGWFYPPSRKDEEVNIMHSYLNGLSYVDAKGEVNFLPPVTVNPAILKIAKCHIKLKGDNGVLTMFPKSIPGGYVRMALETRNYNEDFIVDYFTFVPDEEGYTKIKFNGKFGDKVFSADEDRILTVHDNSLRLFKSEADEKNKKLYIILNSEGADDDYTLKFTLGRKGDSINHLGVDSSDNLIFKEKNVLYFELQLWRLDTLQDSLKGKFKELNDKSSENFLVDVGKSFYSANEALHFCQLIGKCKP